MIMKRDESRGSNMGALEFAKQVSLTTPTDGHTHLIALDDGGYYGPRLAGETSHVNGHSHPWIRTDGDKIVIGEAMGHSHEVGTDVSTGSISKKAKAVAGAMEDGSYPITDAASLGDAIQSFGRAKDKAATARHIQSRAKALGLGDTLPTEGKLADLMKSLASKAAGIPGNVGNKEETNMTDNTNAVTETEAAKKAKAEVETLTKSLEKANKVLALKGASREFFDALEESAKDAFLAKSAEEQSLEISKSKESNPVVFKTASGVEYRKSDDPRLVDLAKQNEELAKSAKAASALVHESELKKRASESLSHLPGDESVHVALLKAVDAIADEGIRAKALETLKAKDAEAAKSFKTEGHRASEETASAEQELDNMAKACAKEKSISFEKAYVEVIKSEKGRELYRKSSAE